MSVKVIVGAQWGDEGKGKITHLLAEQADVVARYQGGSNAGHTVAVEERVFRLHLIPSGILYPNTLCIMADGMAIDPEMLLREMQQLEDEGVALANLRISRNAHVIFPYHRLLDRLEEERRGDERIGTTQRGIGPAYADKSARLGLRMADLCQTERLQALLPARLDLTNRLLTQVYGAEPISQDELLERSLEYGRRLRPYVTNTVTLLRQAYQQDMTILFEGAQGTLLDLDYGSYPYVTSSHTVAAGACLGTGIPPHAIDAVLGVSKAYSTRVGSGPFPTELQDATGDLIRERGVEFGTTTGRPRRCGWLDLALLRYAVMVNGITELAITKLDVLDALPTLRLAIGYRRDGQEVTTEELELDQLGSYEPMWEEWPGWQTSTRTSRSWSDLPDAARRYVERIEACLEIPIRWISVGPRHDQTISRS